MTPSEDRTALSFADSTGQTAQARQMADFAWARERVVGMCANAFADARVYGLKLLKGFGYPNETFRAAQDARALQIVLDQLDALTAAFAAKDWQPIATAPDATYVLVWLPNYGVNVATLTKHPTGDHWWMRDHDDYCYPTHWMPLPAPPSEAR